MKMSRADASRRSPVALRANTSGGAEASVAIRASSLSCDELAGPHAVLAQLDDGPVDHALGVGAAGVDAGRLSDLGDCLGFMDMAVQRQHRLHLLDQRAHRGRSDRAAARLAAVAPDLEGG